MLRREDGGILADHAVFLDEATSTNDEAKLRIDLGAPTPPPPWFVVARKQTAGRGRGDHSWFSDEGSITLTAVLPDAVSSLRPEHWPRASLATAVGLIRGLERWGIPRGRLAIRWPNDLECDGRKFGGILPERHGDCLLIGIGLNVSTDLARAPAEVQAMATTLQEIAGRTLATIGLGDALYRGFIQAIEQLASDSPELAQESAERDSLIGRSVRLSLLGEVISGLGAGIDPSGGLRIATEGGIRTVHAGQVLRGPSGG